MEYQDPLICWAIENAKNLSLKVTQLNWSSSILPYDIHSFSCEVTIGQFKTKGFGKGKTQVLAIKKSIIEAIERNLLSEFNLNTSNGVAGHTIYHHAETNAVNELIERDLFLCHFLTKTPFAKIPEEIYLEKYRKLFDWSNQSNIKFKLYYLGQTGCLGLVDGQNADKPFGYSITSSFSDTLDASIKNTVLNIGQRGFYYYNHQNSLDDISLNEFIKLESPNFDQHGLLALNTEYAASISYLFDGNTGLIGPALNKNSITCSALVSSNPLLKNIPASFAKAESSHAQELFLGLPSEEVLNLNRLSEFSNREQSTKTILNMPHPMD